MLVNLNTLIEGGNQYNYAVAGFTTPTIDTAEAVVAAAEELNAPVVIGHAELYEEFGQMEVVGPKLRELAEKAKVPVCLHLDHGQTIEYITRAIRCGYTSVMADFSMLPFEENARIVKMVVDMCHPANITVEGLMGRMPNLNSMKEIAAGREKLEDYFTDPDEAARFIEITGADALTVSFGTVHGMTVMEPVLNLDRLKELREKVNGALVMHGSSGVAEPQLQQAVSMGLRKVNIYTKMSTAAQPAILEAVQKSETPLYYHEIEFIAKQAMKEKAMQAIQFFSNGHSFKNTSYADIKPYGFEISKRDGQG